MPTLFRRVRYWLARRRRDAELAEELEFHCRMAQEGREQSGMPTADAVHASRRTLGNVTLAREEAREVWGWPSFAQISRDARTRHILLGGTEAESVRGMAVTADFFTVLDRVATLGRSFSSRDERSTPVVVLSDAGWRRHQPRGPADAHGRGGGPAARCDHGRDHSRAAGDAGRSRDRAARRIEGPK